MRFQLKSLSLGAIFCGILSTPAFAIEELNQCMEDEIARAFFATGALVAMPNYTEGPGARVQRQYHQTHMYGHAKFIGSSESGFAACAYSNHVGWVFIYGDKSVTPKRLDIDCDSDACKADPHWRLEFMESSPDLDKPGQEQIYVCVETKKGLDFPSIGCHFKED